MRNIFFLFFCVCFFPAVVFGQSNDSSHVKISLLTCSPGEELYSLFGHTAIRVIDSSEHTDFVYNYGVFEDFEGMMFYIKFARGKLRYLVEKDAMNDFMYEYVYEKRGVEEQNLNLNDSEKKFIVAFLDNNCLPENKYYKYDFLYDNCATRIRDILFDKVKDVQLSKAIVDSNATFRDLIYFYLDRGGQPWSKLGIDILLGSPTDKKLDSRTSMFMPDFLSDGIRNAKIHGQPYVASTKQLLPLTKSSTISQGKYLPLIVISIACIAYLLLYFLGRKNTFATHLLDSILLYITGLLGLLLLFMWFGTDHQTCKNNYNLLWALPTNFIAAFFIWKKRDWVRKYFFIATIITVILLICWWFLPQHFNIALIPFVFLMMIVYGRLARK